MHLLMDSVCRELEDVEKKGLTASNIDMTDKLVNIKKNLMKIDKYEEEGYSERYSGRGYSRDYSMGGEWEARGGYSRDYDRDSSYARRGEHYVRGHYSRDTVSELEMLMNSAKSEREREALRKAMNEIDKA